MSAMSPQAAVDHVLSTNPAFEVHETVVRGVNYRVFKNIPPHVRALMNSSRAKHDNGSAEYIVFENERWSYDDYMRDVNAVASALHLRFGIRKGMPVAIAMRNCPEFLILIAAIASLGAVTVLLNAWWTTEELDYALEDSRALFVFADGKRVSRLKTLTDQTDITLIGVRDGETATDIRFSSLLDTHSDTSAPETEIDTDDDFAIMYSSGTTGHPKGVIQTHRGAMNAVFTWLMQAVMAPLIDPPEPGTPEPPRLSALIVTPLFHVTATHPLFLLSMPAGAKLVLMDKWDPAEAVRLIDREKITRFLGVPTQSADLLGAARTLEVSLDTLDYVGAGGAKRPASQVDQLAEMFPKANIATGWGMTETNANGIGMVGATYLERPNCTGKLYPPVQELRFLDDAGAEVTIGEIGEITVKSPCNMRCYLNKPDATSDVFQDGWLRTGDLGYIDDEGFVTIVDRKKNIVIRGGENISCLDVEGAIHRHPAVLEACAFSVPHPRLGETVGAAVQLRPEASLTQEELTTFLALHIARFKIPDTIWFRPAPLPRGATDKIDRRALRAQCIQHMPEQKETT